MNTEHRCSFAIYKAVLLRAEYYCISDRLLVCGKRTPVFQPTPCTPCNPVCTSVCYHVSGGLSGPGDVLRDTQAGGQHVYRPHVD